MAPLPHLLFDGVRIEVVTECYGSGAWEGIWNDCGRCCGLIDVLLFAVTPSVETEAAKGEVYKSAPALQGKPLVLDRRYRARISARDPSAKPEKHMFGHRVRLPVAPCRSPLREDSPSVVGALSIETARFMSILVFVLVCLSVLMPGASAQQAASVDTRDQELSGRPDSAPDRKPFVSIIYPETLPPLLPDSRMRDWLHRNRVRMYGWVDGGFTYASTGYGLLIDATTPNRFGNEFLLSLAHHGTAGLKRKMVLGISY